jgi:hypothetical protein
VNRIAVTGYADQIMAMIDGDIAQGILPHGKRIPADIESFSGLHDFVDANIYLVDALGADRACDFTDEGTAFSNAILDEVDARLKARWPVIRMRMLETVAFAVAAGWRGVYDEYMDQAELFDVDDDDVDAAAEWLSGGRLTPGQATLASATAENACTTARDDGYEADAARYSALRDKVTSSARLTVDDLRCLSSALCLTIATCDPRCTGEMPPLQRLAERVARMIDNASQL